MVLTFDSFTIRAMTCFIFSSSLLALVLLAGTLAVGGCRSSGEQANAQQSDPLANLSPAEMVEVFERNFRQQLGPNVRVGYVGSTVGDTRVANISDVDTSGLAEGDPLMFFDTRGEPVAFGQILSVDVNQVIAEYEPTFVQNGRRVRQGDLAAFNLRQ